MPNVIQHKRNSTAGLVPSTGSLNQGELAINIGDGKFYTKNSSNSVINLGVTSISGTLITPASGNFLNSLSVSGISVSTNNHIHGNISSSGTIGNTSNLLLSTTTNGVITTIQNSFILGSSQISIGGTYSSLSGLTLDGGSI